MKEKALLGVVGALLSGSGVIINQSIDIFSDLSNKAQANEVNIAKIDMRVHANHDLLVMNSEKMDKTIDKIDSLIMMSIKERR